MASWQNNNLIPAGYNHQSGKANEGISEPDQIYPLSPALYIGALEVMAYAWTSKTGVTCAPLTADYWLASLMYVSTR